MFGGEYDALLHMDVGCAFQMSSGESAVDWHSGSDFGLRKSAPYAHKVSSFSRQHSTHPEHA